MLQGKRLGDETLGRSEQDPGAGDGVLRWGAVGLDVRPPGGTPTEMAQKGEVRLGGIFGEWLAGPDPDRRRDEKEAGLPQPILQGLKKVLLRTHEARLVKFRFR